MTYKLIYMYVNYNKSLGLAIVCEILKLMIFLTIIMHCDVTRCIICISNKVKYLEKEKSKKHFTKEAIY